MISVIVPLYNLESCCSFCLKSLRAQTCEDAEFILVDDGSTDNTLVICQEYAAHDSRFRVFNQENAGVSAARNYGLENARGEYITFADGDDLLDPQCLEKLLAMHTAETSLAMCGHERIFSYDVTWPTRPDQLRQIAGEEAQRRVLAGKLPISVCGVMFRRELVGNIRFATGIRHNEDKLFLFEYICQNKERPIVFSNEKLYAYMVRTGSATRAKNGIVREDIVLIADRLYDETVCECTNLEPLARNAKLSARLDFLKDCVRQGQTRTEAYVRRKAEVLSMPLENDVGKTTRVEYGALRLGDLPFALLVKAYYGLASDRMRFRRNERQLYQK